MKKLTLIEIEERARHYGIKVAALRAVIEVECKASGFNDDGTPVILYERHKFYEGLRAIGWITKSSEWYAAYPDLCNPNSGGYGKYSEQHLKLARASKLNREVALESCSWGVGQVMGYHWKALGYTTLQQFINCMYKSEYEQLDAMCRYIKHNGLIKYINANDWVGFALRYNGKAYKKNNYDVKLRDAYKKFGGA